MWHNAMLLAAALLMAACDSSAGTGDNPDPTMTTDVSNPGKGDDPSQPDTTVPDSGGDTDNNTTADPDTATLDTTAPSVQDTCSNFLDFQGKWRLRNHSDMKLQITLSAGEDGLCNAPASAPDVFNGILPFRGHNWPVTVNMPDASTANGYVAFTMLLDEDLLKINVDDSGTEHVFCFEHDEP